MFGLSKREQRWKAEQEVAELLVELTTAALQADAAVQIAKAKESAALAELRIENARLRAQLESKSE